MQILYIIFLSVLARTSADVLQVKCGDEMCESEKLTNKIFSQHFLYFIAQY